MHRIRKTAAPPSGKVPPTALTGALKDLWGWANKGLFRSGGLPEADLPGLGKWLKQPGQAVKHFAKGQRGHLKRLAEPGGARKALLDVTPLTAAGLVAPELLGMGFIRGIKDAPSEQKGEHMGSAAGRLLGGQLMMRSGLLGGLAGGAVGDVLGGAAGRSIDRARSMFKGKPKPKPKEEIPPQRRSYTYPQPSFQPRGYSFDEDFSGYQYGPGYAKHSSEFGSPGSAGLPEVAGTAPSLAMGGPGMDEVRNQGRFVGRNGPYRKVDEFTRLDSPEMQHIFYAGNGLGSGGGQPYADGDAYKHTGILRGLLNRLNKEEPNLAER